MHISDRSLQAKLTQKAKITFACFLPEVIFAFGGFINDLTRRQHQPPGAFVGHSTGESSMGTLCPSSSDRISRTAMRSGSAPVPLKR